MVVIRFGYSRCTLVNGSSRKILPALRFKDPEAQWTREFREGLASGKVTFYDRLTRSFPTGLFDRVVRRLERLKIRYRVEYPDSVEPVSLKGFRRDMLFGLTMRKHQFRGGIKFLKIERGVLWHATNAGKSPIAAAVALHLKRKLGVCTLLLVPNKGLLHQTAKDVKTLCGGDVRVAQIGDGLRGVGDVVVGTAQTVMRGCPSYVEAFNAKVDRESGMLRRKRKRRARKKLKVDQAIHRFLLRVGCVIVDEAHRAPADSYKHILDTCTKARFRLGLTGTAQVKKKIRDITFRAYVGPILDRVTSRFLMEKGYSATTVVYGVRDRWMFPNDLTVPSKLVSVKEGDHWRRIRVPDGRKRYKKELDRLMASKRYNAGLVMMMCAMVKGGLKPMALTTSIPHLERLRLRCLEKGLNPIPVWGHTPGKRRVDLVRRFSRDPNAALIASTVFDEGVNAPAVGCMLLAGQGKGLRAQIQRVGRAVRAKASGPNMVAIIDPLADNGEFLPVHRRERLTTFRAEGHKIEFVDDLFEFCKRARQGWKGLLGTKRYARALEGPRG